MTTENKSFIGLFCFRFVVLVLDGKEQETGRKEGGIILTAANLFFTFIFIFEKTNK